VRLDIEDELVAGQRLGGGRPLKRARLRQGVPAVGLTTGRECLVEGQERGRGAAQRLEEGPASQADAPGIRGNAPLGFPIGRDNMVRERHRPELAVGRRVELDGQRPAEIIAHRIASHSGLA
jgi:hypothetical protein